MISKFLLAFFSFYSIFGSSAQHTFTLKQGDLLFQDIDCGSYCDAIEKVTVGVKGAKFSHVAIAINHLNSIWVIEAVSKGVILTPIDTFLNRSRDENGNPKVIVGRVENKNFNMNDAVLRAKQFLGKPYDDFFDIKNDAYYCSELVYLCFLNKNNQPIFELKPMTFKDPETGKTFENWAQYFNNLQIPIPENQPGLNPGSISLSNAIKIVHIYGKPDGFLWEQN